jgi:hypothetical protein
MFAHATTFNQDIGAWNVGAGIMFASMFESATNFNQDISGWDVSAGVDFNYMFQNAGALNQNLCTWGGRMQNTYFVSDMFSGATSCTSQVKPSFIIGMTPGPLRL